MTASLRVVAALLVTTTMACGSDRIAVREPGLGTTLTVTVAADAAGKDRTSWSLTCDPAGGTHPDPAAACAALGRLPDPFATTPPDRACTEIYGGPEVAEVTGTYRDRPAAARFARDDGCEIARWDALGPLLEPEKPAE